MLTAKADKTLAVTDLPPQSPDLNIIEAVWDNLDMEVKHSQKPKEEPWERAWYNISNERNLPDRLLKRIQNVLSELAFRYLIVRKTVCSVYIFPVFPG